VRRVSLLAVGLVLTGFNLRIAVASVPPLLKDLERHPGMSTAVAGLLTSLPVLCFGLGALAAAPLARRLGGEAALVLALAPVCAGTLLRAAGSTGALFVGTVLAGAGIAVANVLVPAVIKGRFPSRVGPLMGAYTALLGTGAALAGGLAVPTERALGWQSSLALWSAPVAVAVVVLGAAVLRDDAPVNVRGGVGDARALLRNRLAWQLTLYFAIQSAIFYSGLTWLPSILRDHGFSPATAGALNSVYALVGIPASLLAPVLATRVRDQRVLVVAFALLEPVAVAGLLLAPGAAAGWVPVFALGQGGSFALALTLLVLRSPDARRSAELSGMAQAIGYSIAALGPLLVGVLHAAEGGWTAPLLFLLALGVPMLAAGIPAGRAHFVPPSRGERETLPAGALG
jgi:MFS transporter, CP family, cyanate transporter